MILNLTTNVDKCSINSFYFIKGQLSTAVVKRIDIEETESVYRATIFMSRCRTMSPADDVKFEGIIPTVLA